MAETNETIEVVVSQNATATRVNIVAMRDALKAAKQYLDGYSTNILELRRTVDAALAAPPRNCDVGTAEEQVERWQAFCNRYDEDCTGCPCDAADTWNYTNCFAKWAQTSYEEKEEGAKERKEILTQRRKDAENAEGEAK